MLSLNLVFFWDQTELHIEEWLFDAFFCIKFGNRRVINLVCFLLMCG
jgi:hypothetical protein